MPMSALGIVTVVCAVGAPSVTVKTRVPAVVPVPNETEGPPANCPTDAPSATVKLAERVPSAKVTVGSSLTPLTADWKASVTVPLPLDTDPDARLTERLPCLASVARFSWIDGVGKTGGGGVTPVPWSGYVDRPIVKVACCGPVAVGVNITSNSADEPGATVGPESALPARLKVPPVKGGIAGTVSGTGGLV